ncbi:bifunctional ADP-dependent NAD(P)H-hydrate dehydratase/NAD(P)H-hydrate epimerase [Nocardioides sp. JQ2195]|uniref:bifunctional ADP-dependent NAD(P)H-hydrate dehydratase/NAD(P)H-hydrate epimerase n=1 Tax=Nocardioides sp. JQ2195 TaxID=2592334 RepID=UPI00143E3555|nr:bifunctional ADP-dependent NAD(P)H-hydrate dehydratase/NAD(P)H-hydrate epimerase [Nocardioides sp. JQ2195]QIX25798.1 bifunctional ADP-dependent NAD(P)H-hydrate dehydratase/NAD(P)H-hydrate epimerase [Nocardioides sp. JQ2195]
MRSAHTVEQVRAAEAVLLAELPEGSLMARAASGLATAVIDLLGGAYGRRVVLLVGSGDNGGDALYAGALLARRGCAVEAITLSDRVHGGGLAALRGAGGTVRSAATGPTARPDVVVDGIVGIGGRPGLRPDAVAAVAAYAGVPLVAVDVPSGIDVGTGELDGPHVTADVTVTFGTHKVAHLVEPAASACGTLTLVDIGLDLPPADVEALQPDDVARLVSTPAPTSHKYTRGVVGLRTGGAFAGAGLLSVAGASCGVAGMVRYVGSDAAGERVLSAHPEVVLGEGRVQAWVVGSGGGPGAVDERRTALADGVPVVLDADALLELPDDLPADAVLTPHAGELARMLDVERDDVEARQLHWVREAARRTGAVCLLKGHHTLVADPDGRVRVTTTGSPWLATAGAGDVLGGVIGAVLAVGLTPFDAASVGSWLHGAAATLASRGGPIVARDVAVAVPDVVRRLALRS